MNKIFQYERVVSDLMKIINEILLYGTDDFQSTTPPSSITSYEIFKLQAYNQRSLCVLYEQISLDKELLHLYL